MDIATCACAELAPLFDADPRADKFAQLIDKPPGAFRCEYQSVTARSTGAPVMDGEKLVRVVVSPRDLDKNSPSELGENCVLDVARSGMSVLRVKGGDANNAAEIVAMARNLVSIQSSCIPDTQEAVCLGVIEFDCVQARNFLFKGQKALGVYELPEIDYPSHAEVFIAVNLIGSINKSKIEARNFLEEIRGCFIPADKYTRAALGGIAAKGRRASA